MTSPRHARRDWARRSGGAEVAVGEDAEQLIFRIDHRDGPGAYAGHREDGILDPSIRRHLRHPRAGSHDFLDAEQEVRRWCAGMQLRVILFPEAARFEEDHGQRIADRQRAVVLAVGAMLKGQASRSTPRKSRHR